MTHAKLCLAAAIAAAVMITGCRREPDDTPDTNDRANAAAPATDAAAGNTGAGTPASDTSTAADTAPATTAASPGMVAPGEALTLVAAVDEHEIAAAQQAKRKEVKGAVLEYANLLEREHSANLQAGKALSTGTNAIPAATSSMEADTMREKGRTELSALDQKSGADYEKAWLDAMVKGHTEALTLLEERLIPAAQDERLRSFLNNSRDHVAMHLARGKELQSQNR